MTPRGWLGIVVIDGLVFVDGSFNLVSSIKTLLILTLLLIPRIFKAQKESFDR